MRNDSSKEGMLLPELSFVKVRHVNMSLWKKQASEEVKKKQERQ